MRQLKQQKLTTNLLLCKELGKKKAFYKPFSISTLLGLTIKAKSLELQGFWKDNVSYFVP